MTDDPFIRACPLYRQAQRTNNATGEALEVTEGPSMRPWFLAAVCVLIFVGLCFIAGVS
jgi:hypothetical protein